MLQISVMGELACIKAVERCKKWYELFIAEEAGDVPGWVLVVLMTTGLVTMIWALAAPKLSSLLNDSLNSMNNIR
jgi:hypothetical protein